jgi:hypothetical protein
MAGGSGIARADPDTVKSGHDLLETVSEQGTETYIDFGCLPLPADFFGPGSDPFDGLVYLEGDPSGTFDGFSGLEPTDTIIERLQDAGPTFPDTIDVEIVQLELVSTAPITVTYEGGMYTEPWDLRVQVLNGYPVQDAGTMTIRHEVADGGTFDIELPVLPEFIFTKVDPPYTQGSYVPALPMQYQASEEPWCHTANPLDVPSGQVVIEKPGLTTNFFPGIDCGPPRTKYAVGLDADLDQCDYAHHEVKAAEREQEAVGGVAELPDVALTGAQPSTALSNGSGWSALTYAALGAGVGAAALALGSAAWYARRRWVR